MHFDILSRLASWHTHNLAVSAEAWRAMAVSAEAWRAFRYLITPLQYLPRLGMLFYIGRQYFAAARLDRRGQSHSQRPASLRWRRGSPLLAAARQERARLTDSVTRLRCCANTEVCVIVRIWNTLIVILCLLIHEFINESIF